MNSESTDTNWRQRANCKGSNIDLFYPEDDISFDKALEICKGCPVIKECRDYGLRNERFGVHGGLTPNQKNKERKRLNITINTTIVDSFIKSVPPHMSCGTNAGYAYLWKLYNRNPEWEKIQCDECLKAHSEYIRKQREDPEERARVIEYQRAYDQRVRQDPERLAKYKARRREVYARQKMKKAENRLDQAMTM